MAMPVMPHDNKGCLLKSWCASGEAMMLSVSSRCFAVQQSTQTHTRWKLPCSLRRLKDGGAMLCDEVGLGKTTSAAEPALRDGLAEAY